MNEHVGRFRSRSLMLLRFVLQRGLLKAVVWRTTRVTVRGKDRLASLNAPFIVVANHSSHLDAPLVFGALPRRLARYLAAGAAADYFFDVRWRHWLTMIFFNAYPVDRTGGGQRPRLSKALLAARVPLLLFPEGGRAKNGEIIREFMPGAAALSIGNNVPIVPCGIVDSQKAMPRDRSWPVKPRVPVAVVFGDPVSALPDETVEDFSRRLREIVSHLSSGGVTNATRHRQDGWR